MGMIGVETEDDLARIEQEAIRLHAAGLLDADALNDRMAVVAGIRRVRASGREDLAWQLLHAWQSQQDGAGP